MQSNISSLNNTITIKFVGTVSDFDGQKCNCDWDVPSNLNESVSDLISGFFQISGLNAGNYRFYFNGENLKKYEKHDDLAASIYRMLEAWGADMSDVDEAWEDVKNDH